MKFVVWPRPANPRERSREWWRRLTLIGPDGRFLDRWGLSVRGWFGVYVHRIVDEDPGVDLHDHPWPFATVILWGGYAEEVAEAREAPMLARIAEATRELIADDALPGDEIPNLPRGIQREWRRGTVHRMPLTHVHRITSCAPHTWTLVLVGRKSRSWGFYQSDGFVDHRHYDYDGRRPGKARRRKGDAVTGGV